VSATVLSAHQLYETVNEIPQLAVDSDNFAFYWGVWRGMSDAEQKTLNGEPGVLISKRLIHWQTYDCKTRQRIHADQELFWYWDELRLNGAGALDPLPEAPRSGYRYFSLLSANGLFLKGLPPFTNMPTFPGERRESYRQRNAEALKLWRIKASPVGTYGDISTENWHRLWKESDVTHLRDQFYEFAEYTQLPEDVIKVLTRYNPKAWPIYYDERAHKPHTLKEIDLPDFGSLTANKLRLRFRWNWCDTGKPVLASAEVAKGELPPPGPNRSGRPDRSGDQVPLKISEVDWTQKQ